MRSHRVVLVFARLPRDERRIKPLAAGAAPERVEALHEAMLRTTLAAARASGADVRLVTIGRAPASLVAPDVEVVPQVGDSFAARLDHAVADAFGSGWRHVAVVGGDTPALTAAHLRAAFAALDAGHEARAVIGPATDGGYYLLALNAPAPRAFCDDTLGTRDACSATVAALADAGFVVARLSLALADVDDATDARALSGHLRALARALFASPPTPARAAPPRARCAAASIRPRGPPVLVDATH